MKTLEQFKLVFISSLLLAGCVNQQSSESIKENSTMLVTKEKETTISPVTNEEVETPIQIEHLKLFERIKELELMAIENTEKPVNISGKVKLMSHENEPYLSIDVVFDKPKKVMKNTLALVIFDKSLQDYVIADYPYVTNYHGQEITISPEKDPKGFSIERGVPLQDNLVDKDKFVEAFEQVKILLVYEDSSGNLKREYFITSTGDFKISNKLLSQIN